MKRILLIIWFIGATVANTMSQTTNECINKSLEQGNLLYLYMKPNEYKLLSDISKATIISKEVARHQVQGVYVVCDNESELWQKTDVSIRMIDAWDKNKTKRFLRSIEHPWFFNLSMAIGMSLSPESESNLFSMTASGFGRFGCYLLKERWDLALNGLIGYHIDDEDDGSFSSSVGVDTRVYILKGKAINPFAGIGVALATSNGEASFTIPLSAGLNIPVTGKGCIDFCYQYNKVTKSTFIIGYTYMHR